MAQVDRLLSGPMSALNMASETTSTEGDDQRKKKATEVALRDSFRHGRTAQQAPSPSFECPSSRKYAEYSTERLIELSRESSDECKLIAKELNRRCGGNSIGYLSSMQLLTLCEYYASSRLLSPDELVRVHSQLQLDVQQLTDHDPFEILAVPTDKLLHLAALTLCLQNTTRHQ